MRGTVSTQTTCCVMLQFGLCLQMPELGNHPKHIQVKIGRAMQRHTAHMNARRKIALPKNSGASTNVRAFFPPQTVYASLENLAILKDVYILGTYQRWRAAPLQSENDWFLLWQPTFLSQDCKNRSGAVFPDMRLVDVIGRMELRGLDTQNVLGRDVGGGRKEQPISEETFKPKSGL